MIQLFHQWPGHLEKQLAFVSKRDARAVPDKERHGHFTFECLNLLRDRRLAEPHELRRLGNTARRRGVAEAAELLKPILLVPIGGITHSWLRRPRTSMQG